MPELSIITISYNMENEIAKTIESVLDQDFSDYEYIFIDEYSFGDKEKHNKNYPNKIIQNFDGDGVKYLYLLKNILMN